MDAFRLAGELHDRVLACPGLRTGRREQLDSVMDGVHAVASRSGVVAVAPFGLAMGQERRKAYSHIVAPASWIRR